MTDNIEFAKLAELFKNDPVAADEYVESVIQNYITNMNTTDESKQRLRAFHFRIQRELSSIKHPIARLAKMETLLWDQVNELHTALTSPSKLMEKQSKSAKVVQFNRVKNEEK